ncbi:hypothetical protein [Cellvibrio sp. pealriver]|uniref:hypothetical protein n=1 Tax=Cellvibrio sp. pealriver TaxID=1622269 RepID=UPI00066FDC07|nr:hypothetical protein [Cellvibrio sp. pealriver]
MSDKSDLDIDSGDEEKPRSLVFDFSVIFILITIVLIVMMYFYLTSPLVENNNWGGPEQFGQFGDFIGGLVNPLVGICTLGLVMWTITIQRQTLMETRKELNLTRRELIASNSLLANQNVFADKEHKLKLLESAADRQIEEFEKSLYLNAIEFSDEFWVAINGLVESSVSRRNPGRNSIANLAIFLATESPENRDKLNFQLSLEYKKLSAGVIGHIIKLSKLNYVFNATLEEMNELLPSVALQKYWKDRLDEYEIIFNVMTIDYVKTAENGKAIIQCPISI